MVQLCRETFQRTAEYLRGEMEGKYINYLIVIIRLLCAYAVNKFIIWLLLQHYCYEYDIDIGKHALKLFSSNICTIIDLFVETQTVRVQELFSDLAWLCGNNMVDILIYLLLLLFYSSHIALNIICHSFIFSGTIDDYKLLETMNKITLSKYSDMKIMASNISSSLNDLNDKCKLIDV